MILKDGVRNMVSRTNFADRLIAAIEQKKNPSVVGLDTSFSKLPVYYLPEEIVERITSGVDFSYHLVEVSAKLVYADLFAC
mgnify:CR=1 FL=1